MIEIVNPSHPDKIADRIAGALVDIAYENQENPKIAAEVLIGHGTCNIIIESSYDFEFEDVAPVVDRIAGPGLELNLIVVPQDGALADNQRGMLKCGDNGIFKGVPLTKEEIKLSNIAHDIYKNFPYDGKYILDEEDKKLIVCQSHCSTPVLRDYLQNRYPEYRIIVNPLGDWTGGLDVDTGATNRKLGSDQGHSVTGGGINGKDLSKADVAVNIYAFLEAQIDKETKEYYCSIGDKEINGIPYEDIIKRAKDYIDYIGGFEKLSEWGLF